MYVCLFYSILKRYLRIMTSVLFSPHLIVVHCICVVLMTVMCVCVSFRCFWASESSSACLWWTIFWAARLRSSAVCTSPSSCSEETWPGLHSQPGTYTLVQQHTHIHSLLHVSHCVKHSLYVVCPLSFYPTVYSIFSTLFIQTRTSTEFCSLGYFIALPRVIVPAMCSGLCKLGHALESPVSDMHAPWRNNGYANPVEI